MQSTRRACILGSKWVSTVVTGVKYDAAVSQGFMRLFHYIQGANSASAQIPMTAPVRVTLTPGDGPFCENNFTVSFFVPYDGDGVSTTQIDPPEPTDPEVCIDEDPDGFVAFVWAFGGWTNEEKLIAQAETLGEDLESDGLDDVGDREHFVFAGYGRPSGSLGGTMRFGSLRRILRRSPRTKAPRTTAL